MRSILRHARIPVSAFAVLFLAANSGFTLVLSYCTMGEMPCCDEHGAVAACQAMGAPLAGDVQAISGSNSCHALRIAGGMRTDAMVLHNDVHVRHLRCDIVSVAAAPDGCILLAVATPHHSSELSSNGSPPPVEKYVLNSSFLI